VEPRTAGRRSDSLPERPRRLVLPLEILPGGNEPVQLFVDAPGFVILEGVKPPVHPETRVEARLVLPGSERPGWDGTTWVDLGSFRYARDPKWLRDGGLLVAPRDVPSDLMSITAHGTSPARVEVTSTWYALPWFTTGPLHLRDGRILDDRVRAHDRNSCGSISVVRRNSERELLRDATFRIRALSTLQRPDLSAVRRDNPEWTRPFAALTGQPLQLVTGQQGRLWTPGCLPVGTYEVEVRHPR